LPRLVIRPEAYSTQEERPAKRFTRVRVGRGQAGIVLQHEHLEFEKLFKKVDVTDGFVFDVSCSVLEIMTAFGDGRKGSRIQLVCPSRIIWESLTTVGDDIINKPDIRLVQQILIPIDLLLIKRPIWQPARVGPQSHPSGHMNQLLAAQRLSLMSVGNIKLEQGIVVPGHVIPLWPRRKLLIGRHERRRDVVCKKVRVGADVQELDNILVSNDSASSMVRNIMCRDDLPFVVGVGMVVACYLLTWSAREKRLHLPRVRGRRVKRQYSP
jgi:hypothetical protein